MSELDVPVYVHSAGLSALAPVRAQGLSDGQCVSEGGFEIIALATEGHTQDSMCYAVGDALFTGDTLFNGSVGGTGNTDLFLQETGNIRRKILTLPDHVTVFPGHGPITTVSIERTFNPFL